MKLPLRMSKLSEAKTLGGIGSILMLLVIVPSAGWVLALVGAILSLFAVKYVSDAVAEPAIFRNMLIAIILAVVGLFVGVAVIAAAVLGAVGLGALGQNFPGSMPPMVVTGDFVRLIVGAIAGLAVVWVLLIVSAYFVRKSYSTMGARLGVGIFGTTGLLYLIGAALTIILVGFIIIFVALILNIIAFWSIPDQAPMAHSSAPSPAPTTT